MREQLSSGAIVRGAIFRGAIVLERFLYLYHFYVQYFKKMSETPLYTQELHNPSDFSTASNSSVFDGSENLQKEISTQKSLYEASLDTHELEYSESEMFLFHRR